MTILGDCPYCDTFQMNEPPDNRSGYAMVECDECHQQYWLKFSAIDATAWTIEGFEEEFEVDMDEGIIRDRKTGRIVAGQRKDDKDQTT